MTHDHEIGMDAPVIKGLERQCQVWKDRVAELSIEVQELKEENAALQAEREEITKRIRLMVQRNTGTIAQQAAIPTSAGTAAKKDQAGGRCRSAVDRYHDDPGNSSVPF